jgi:hypothetical protein
VLTGAGALPVYGAAVRGVGEEARNGLSGRATPVSCSSPPGLPVEDSMEEKRPGAPGHRSVKTTMIYTHVLNRGGLGVRSPADGLLGAAPLPGRSERK